MLIDRIISVGLEHDMHHVIADMIRITITTAL